MTAASLLTHLQSLGARLRVQGDKLRCDAPKGVITAQLKEQLLQHKRELTELLLAAPQAPAASPITPGSLDGDLPLSFGQQRMWLLEQIDSTPGVYNIPVAARLPGPLDVSLLEASIARIVQRHAALRTTFQSVQGRALARITPHVDFSLLMTDLSHLPAEVREREVDAIREQEALQLFDLSQGPLFRCRLLRIAPQEHRLLVTFHHAVCDGWSLGVFLRELADLYGGRTAGREHVPADPPIQYPDYARWQRDHLRGDVLARQLDYWRETLAGELPALDLPSDQPRPAVQTFRGGLHRVELPADLVASLERLAQAEHGTLFMALLALCSTLLARYSRRHDVVIGTPIAGRTRPEFENLIGLFVNTLPLRIDLAGEPTFRQLLARARQTALDAYAHQDVPFERLVETLQPRRDMSRSPLFQAMLILQNAPLPQLRLGQTSLTVLPDTGQIAKFDLTLEVECRGGQTFAAWNYSRDVLTDTMVERMAGQFETLARAAVADPDVSIETLPLLSPAERRQIVCELNATDQPYETGLCLHEWIERAVDLQPETAAVVFEGASLSYGQLECRANRLARWLMGQGIGPDRLVGVSCPRSLDLVVSLLAILKAGGAYVPLDPSYPPGRLADMVADSRVALVLTGGPAPWLAGVDVRRVVVEEAIGQEPDESRPRSGAGPGNLAYMIYTSGSTGRPKGALNEHRGIVNRLLWMQQQYGLGPQDRVLQKTPFGFDVSVWELFWPLMQGAVLVVAKPEGHRDPAYLSRLIGQEHISTVHFVPSMLEVFLEQARPAECASLQRVICSGEALPWDLVQRYRRTIRCRLDNLYGPTEAAVDVTYWPCARDAGAKVIPIGYPVANTQVYILDGRLEPVPRGVAGQIYLGGIQVGRGYWGRPALTAERFVPDPFGSGGRLYQTGDAGRYREDGSLEYLGRLDDQVKVRGQRIELGEIEACLREHPAVREAAVAVQGRGREQRLVGYVVGRGETRPDVPALRGHLRARLPESMVPAAWVMLERLPLSPNGKLDRKALPQPDASLLRADRQRIAPRTVVEQHLASIWSAVLPAADISVEDDFFELGGHSLLAAQVVARVRDAFQVEIPLRAVFESPTLEGLARAIERASQDSPHRVLPPATVAKCDGELPLSFSQQRLWFLEQLEPGTPLYNVPASVRLTGPLDADVLTRAINEVVRRHETLRTVFRPGTGEGAQRILPSLQIDLAVEDLSELAAGQKDEAVDGASRAETRQPFDLLHGPLLRLRLLKLAPAEHVLLLTMHHIICDGWSIGVFLRETAQLYEAFRQGRASPLQDLPIQYADLATWQRNWLEGETLADQFSFWRDYLVGAPLALDLPTDRPRPPEQTHHGATCHFTIPPALVSHIDRISRQEGATPFMTLLSIFALLLARYTNQQDIVIGSPVAGRRNTQAEALIGVFVNTLPLRLDLSARPSFRRLLARTRDAALKAFAHQDVPFEKLVDELQPLRDTSRTPLFQVVLAMQNMPLPELRLGDLTLTPLPEPDEVAKFDLLLTVQPAGPSLRASLNYNRDLFDDSTIARMVTHFEQLLHATMAHPDAPVTTLAMMSDEECLTLDRWNDTATHYPRTSSVHELFEQQASLRPDAVAVVDGDRALTYRQLSEQANAWAHRLVDMGVGLETPVGLCVERSAETIVAMLAIFKAGALYVPLDPNFPQDRLRFMLADTGASTILAQRRFLDRLVDPGLRVLCIDDAVPGVASAPRAAVEAGNLAYIMYTSGSTGTPKGVAVTHRGIVRLVRDTIYATFDEHQVFLQMAPLSFDASTLEIWAPLLNGGRLAILPPGTPSAEELGDALCRHGVTTLWLTAGLFHRIVEHDLSLLDGVRQLLAGGDVLSPPHVRRVLERSGQRVLINGYGPTECTTFTCCCPLTRADEVGHTVSIGRPISNTQVHILDVELQPVPVGVPGELYVGGDGLARGYVNEPALTAETFIPNPFSQARGERLYRTGDLARYLGDGRIEFLGRTDRQVKIRGFRIEPGEIEAALMQHADVRAAVAVARADGASDKRLVAYIIAQPGRQATSGELRQFLQRRMPDYMVPAAFVCLDAFPLTANGKVDRAALPAPESARPVDAAFAPPATDVEAALTRIWADVLRLERVGVTDNFFELGGDSILSLQVVSRAQRAGIRLTTRQIFQHQTISQLAAVAQVASAVATAPESQSGDLPLLPAQRWFFELDPFERHHWNQSVLLAVPAGLNWPALQKALLAVIARHDALRLRFDRDGSQWRQRIAAAGEPVPAERIDVAALSPADCRAAIAAHCERLQRSLDLHAGPILRMAWFDAGATQAGRLLIVVHHLATDGVSWRIVLEDLQAAYADAVAGRAAELPAPATSLQQWAQRLAEHARCQSLRSELSYWCALRQCPEPPVDMRAGANTERSADRVTIELDPVQTASLLREVPQAYHTHIDEVLLTALARTLVDWTGSQVIAIDLEGHGREPLPDEADLSRSVGWLTSMYPVVLDLPAGGKPGRVLCTVKEQLRAVPNRGIGFGLLRYLADGSAAEALKAVRSARVRFNYLGQFDQVLTGGPSVLFAPADEPIGPEHSADAPRSHWIEVNALIAVGRLRVDWIYSRNIHRRETIERLAVRYRGALEELIAHCCSSQAGGATPADFPLAGVDADQLTKIAAMLGRKVQ